MKKLALVMLVVLFATAVALGQYTKGTGLTGIDVLGAHQNGGRGCAGCHAPHSGALGGGGNAATGAQAFNDPLTGSNALFGQDVTPLYGQTLTFGNGYVEALPAEAAAYTTNQDELRGIMMCLACHDGAIAKGQMMAGRSWEQATNLLPVGVYGTRPIPTLLGNDGTGAANEYGNDHPVGTGATLGALRLVSANGGAAGDALKVTWDATNGITNIAPLSASYVQFAANYGYPAIAGTKWDWGFHMPNGATDPSKAFMTCTTCHNQHVMYIYQTPAGYGSGGHAQPGSAIAGGTFPTYFFVNGPYNPGAGNTDPTKAASATQFCRQCHTGEQNEALGVNNVATQF